MSLFRRMMILLCLDQADSLNLKDETISTLYQNICWTEQVGSGLYWLIHPFFRWAKREFAHYHASSHPWSREHRSVWIKDSKLLIIYENDWRGIYWRSKVFVFFHSADADIDRHLEHLKSTNFKLLPENRHLTDFYCEWNCSALYNKTKTKIWQRL